MADQTQAPLFQMRIESNLDWNTRTYLKFVNFEGLLQEYALRNRHETL